eukprot:4403546-Alexandrium_andersonii.AAC.1
MGPDPLAARQCFPGPIGPRSIGPTRGVLLLRACARYIEAEQASLRGAINDIRYRKVRNATNRQG